MKTFLLTLCLMAVAVTCSPSSSRGHHGPRFYLFKESFEKCLADYNISKEEFKRLIQSHDPKTNCIVSCTLTNENIMDGAGHINEEKAVAKVVPTTTSHMPHINADELTAAIRSCITKTKGVEDKCAKANSLMHCHHDFMKTQKKGPPAPGAEGEMY